jgi:flavorubredoxin
MQIKVDEIEADIFRIAIFPENGFISFNQFLIRDEKPALIHTGHKQTFEAILGEVAKLIDPAKLEYLCFSHYEPDECGSLNEWLETAPNAVACANKICESSLKDFAIKPSMVLKDGDKLNLGTHELLFLETPHFPHNWEASLFFETKNKTLFSSDLGTQKGFPQANGAKPDLNDIILLQKRLGYMPFGVHLTEGVKRMKQLEIDHMAAMHGAELDRAEMNELFSLLEAENTEQMIKALEIGAVAVSL